MKVYTDTSVIRGCFDKEYKIWSNALMDEFAAGYKKLMLSDLTLRELKPAWQDVRDKINLIPKIYTQIIDTRDDAVQLAESYIREGALTNKSYNDALHIALATLNGADMLASWNFRHIVNLDRIRLYNQINKNCGYNQIEIRAPREILSNIVMESYTAYGEKEASPEKEEISIDAVKMMREIREKLSITYWDHPEILKKDLAELRLNSK